MMNLLSSGKKSTASVPGSVDVALVPNGGSKPCPPLPDAGRKYFDDLLKKEEDLAPELQSCVEEVGNLGPCLRHPLVFSVRHVPQLNALMNESLRQKKAWLEEAVREKKWSVAIFLHERPYRLMAFIKYMRDMADIEYWELLGEIWRDSENIWQHRARWRGLLRSRRLLSERFMSDEEREAFARLPETLAVYRGYIRKLNKTGLSYTLNLEKAKFFASRYYHKGEVLTRTVKKKNVFAYLTGRHEDEVIIL